GARRERALPVGMPDRSGYGGPGRPGSQENPGEYPGGAPPFGAIWYFESTQPLRRKDRPMSDGTDEARRLRVNDEFAHFRIDAIGADDNVGIDLHAVLKNEADRTAQFLERPQPMIEGY